MDTERTLRFLKILLDGENLYKQESPFKYGLSGKTTKRILDAFSIQLVNKKPDTYQHNTSTLKFFRIKICYFCKNNTQQNFVLTVNTKKNHGFKANEINKYLREYFYLKFIFHVLFTG